MLKYLIYTILIIIATMPLYGVDLLVTNSGKIIIGKINSSSEAEITITDHRKTYRIPGNRVEFQFSLPELSTRRKIEILPKGLPIHLDRIEGFSGTFFGVSGDKIILNTRGKTRLLHISEIENAYQNDFPDIRLFNLLRILEAERKNINIRTYELGEIETEILHFDSHELRLDIEGDTLSLALTDVLAINGEGLFEYEEQKNSFSKRYLFLPSSFIGSAEGSSVETVCLYYNAFSYNIRPWLQIGGGFSSLNIIEQFTDHPLSFSIKACLPISDYLNLYSETMVFYYDKKMPALSHIGINYGSTENNFSVIYSYQSELDEDFSPHIMSMAGVCRLYKSLYYTTEFSILEEQKDRAFITSNALQLNIRNFSFKLGAIYFIAEKKEYSILPLLKAEFDF